GAADGLPAGVRASIVHEDELAAYADRLEVAAHLSHDLLDDRRAVIDRHDDRNHRPSITVSYRPQELPAFMYSRARGPALNSRSRTLTPCSKGPCSWRYSG